MVYCLQLDKVTLSVIAVQINSFIQDLHPHSPVSVCHQWQQVSAAMSTAGPLILALSYYSPSFLLLTLIFQRLWRQKVSFHPQMPTWSVLSPAVLSLCTSPVTSLSLALPLTAESRQAAEPELYTRSGIMSRVWNIFSYLSRWTCWSPSLPNLLLFILLSPGFRGVHGCAASHSKWHPLYSRFFYFIIAEFRHFGRLYVKK